MKRNLYDINIYLTYFTSNQVIRFLTFNIFLYLKKNLYSLPISENNLKQLIIRDTLQLK